MITITKVRNWSDYLGMFLTFFVLYIISMRNYLLFHTIVESLTLIIIGSIYIMATRTYKFSNNHYLMFLGNAHLFIGVLTFFHMITFYGMAVLPIDTPNTATQFWIASRYLLAFSLLIAPFYFKRNYPVNFWVAVFTFLTGIAIVSILWLNNFPVCFDGSGLTTFKVVSEYVIMVLFIGGLLQLIRHKEENKEIQQIMMAALLLLIVSELGFSLYKNIDDKMNFFGHIFGILGYYLVYTGLVRKGLESPYETIFKKVTESSNRDYLTGLYNRKGLMEKCEAVLSSVFIERKKVSALVIDLDNFKRVNDEYGHAMGDRVLKTFAEILVDAAGGDAITARLGGDEFVVLKKADEEEIEATVTKIRDSVEEWKSVEEAVTTIGVSIGRSTQVPHALQKLDCLLKIADQDMYREKGAKKK